MPVNSEHPDYSRMVGKWNRCRDVTDGQDAVHGAREKYLSKLKDQPDDEYLAYVNRTPFYNATWRTVAGLVGMLFRKPPKIEVPAAVEPLLEDITLSGIPFQLFLQSVCEEALKLGRLGLLVDYPSVDTDGMTQADAQRLNLRPVIQMYRAEKIINWRLGQVNNVTKLVQVVLEECIYIPEDEFKKKEQTQYRVLDLFEGRYRVRIFYCDKVTGKEQQIGEDLFPTMNNKPMEEIPFTFLATDDNTAEVDEPPLIDLVNLNLSHYRTSADLEHGAHFTGLPTPVVAGYTAQKEGEKLYIGSSAAWLLADPQAKATYLEFTGEGLGALEKLIEHKETQMAILGARMLEPQKKGVETADSQAIHRKGEESMLSAAAQAISDGVTVALRWFCEWAGSPDESAEVELNRDFYPQPMTDKMMTALVNAWQTGAISDQVLFENLQGGEVISLETTLEQEQARIAAGGMRLAGQNVDPKTGLPAAPPKTLPRPKKKVVQTPSGQRYEITEE